MIFFFTVHHFCDHYVHCFFILIRSLHKISNISNVIDLTALHSKKYIFMICDHNIFSFVKST